MTTKVSGVTELFRQPDWYVKGWRVPIEIRAQTVRDFVGSQHPANILDIGCGDGSVTIPLLDSAKSLTLLDLSDKMLAIAKNNVPKNLLDRVTFIEGNVTDANLIPRSYDLIVCVGVLAHVESPDALISQICRLIAPGGTIVVECTDAQHFLTRVSSIKSKITAALKPPSYALNKVTAAWVIAEFSKFGCDLMGRYRHTFSLPMASRFLSPSQTRAAIRVIFGDGLASKNGWLGNQCIFSFRQTGI